MSFRIGVRNKPQASRDVGGGKLDCSGKFSHIVQKRSIATAVVAQTQRRFLFSAQAETDPSMALFILYAQN